MPRAPATRTERPSSTRTRATAPSRRSSTTVSGADREYKFNFGRHGGKTLYQVPADYVQWCIRANVAEERKDPKFIAAIKKYQEKYPSAQQRMTVVKDKVPVWLYNACDRAFDAANQTEMSAFWSNSGMRRHEEEKADALEEMARSFAPFYPPRPLEGTALPDSESVKDLRTVLSLLPEGVNCENMKELYNNTEVPDKTNSVYVHEDMLMGGMYRELTEHRRTELQHFLKMVGKAHGEQVRALAAWEVYDKVVKCIGGITYMNGYREKMFNDSAGDWIQIRARP